MTLPLVNDAKSLADRLDRAVTLDNACLSDCMDDDLRMLRRLGARLVGRAAHVWKPTRSDEAHFELAARFARRVHTEVDADVVVQAAIFEVIYPQVEEIEVPGWVFEVLGEKAERRRFRFEAMWSDLGMSADQSPNWAGGGRVPDLTRAEARRWVIYRAGRYLDAGYEGLHLGQIHMIGARDVGFGIVAELCERIREMARMRARRGVVLLDAHSHGIVRGGKCLFDFASRPLSGRARLNDPVREDLILQWKDGCPGGEHPGGWYAERYPTLVEVDNWGGRTWPIESWADREGRAGNSRWGRDDVTWFAWQSDEVRAEFLKYAYRFHRAAGVHFQMPLARTLGNDPQSARPCGGLYYRANLPSEACPDGWGDEEVVAALWGESAPKLPARPAPSDLVKLPGPVVLLGEIQRELGGVPGDTVCPFSQLIPVAGAICERLLVLPRAGEHRFHIAIGGTRTEPLGQAMSHGGPPWCIVTESPGEAVFVRFDYQNRTFEIERMMA